MLVATCARMGNCQTQLFQLQKQAHIVSVAVVVANHMRFQRPIGLTIAVVVVVIVANPINIHHFSKVVD